MKRALLLLAATALGGPAHAQLTTPVMNGDTTITVTGTKPRNSKIEMSGWRMAETPHVVVFSQGEEKLLIEAAHKLEKLHFLLTVLTGRVDEPDDTIKIAVTMIGDAGEFEQLRLTESRWQYGPYVPQFAKTIYYDPREEGSVLASTNAGVNLVIQPSTARPTSRNCAAGERDQPLNSVSFAPSINSDGSENSSGIVAQLPVNEIAFCLPAESRLYSGFAQNYLMTYFPAAYPRWYLQGFGELFATMVAKEDYVEYGHVPTGFWRVMEEFHDFPVAQLLDGRYLTGKRSWTPYHAWRIAHLLYFSDEWKPRLKSYLAALARGDDPKRAALALGDPGELQRAVNNYRGRKVQHERITYPAALVPAPMMRRLTRAEGGLIRGRLELGPRIELPAESSPAGAADVARRETWLNRLRVNASRFPDLIENHLLLAEAECRSGNAMQCLQSADRALAISPTGSAALVWRGTALTQLAVRAPAGERRARLKQARATIAQAHRLDPNGILPLIAYYDSFAMAEQPAPDVAVDGLFKVVASSPAAPKSRLMLGKELVDRDLDTEARRTLLPVAKGPFNSPEKMPSAELLRKAEATEP